MFSSNTTQVSGAAYEISRSLRFNSADSAYLNRTVGSASNRRKWTWSSWVKRSKIADQKIFAANTGTSDSTYFQLYFGSNDAIRADGYSTSFLTSLGTAIYRDVSAWYHIMLVADTDNATATNRLQLYVNGSLIASANVTGDLGVNNAGPFDIGRTSISGGVGYIDAYMTEIYLIDGQALTPSSFGATNAQTGVWGPIAYGGSYGTNGFYINFSDNSNTTAATLGKDYSGNGNNFTPNNFSVTAGVGNDSMVDVPTPYGVDTGAGGTVRGNYCTLNPLIPNYQPATFSNGNLEGAASGGGWTGMQGTLSVSTGKWYWEVNVTTSDNLFVGIARTTMNFATINPQNVSGSVVYFAIDGHKRVDGTDTTYGATFAIGDIMGVALDLDANTVTFYKNNSSQGAISLASTTLNGTSIIPLNATAVAGTTAVCNFGQRAFVYTAPSGFKALCTQNLPTPTIGATSATQAGKFFNPVIYTGAGGSQSITGVGFQPDFVWMKGRNTTTSNILQNSVTGVTKGLESNTTAAEFTDVTTITAFNADGYTAGGNSQTNGSGTTFVSWNWRASNATAVTNTAGSLTSQVSANTTSGFSVLTYTGNPAAAQTIGHGLGVAPSMIIVKGRTGGNWSVYHKSLGLDQYVFLNSTAAANTVTGYWGTTNPSSTVFGVIGGGYGNNSGTAVGYCFAPIEGYSAFGSYTGNGATDGPFVYTGFRPAFVMVKNASNPYTDWYIIDAARNPYNATGLVLRPDTSGAEQDYTPVFDFLSNGLKIRDGGSPWNGGSEQIIYACFAKNPFKYSLAQ